MPHAPELRKHFGWKWRTVTRPAALKRAGGQFQLDWNGREKYIGGAHCEICGWVERAPGRRRSKLDVAHLDHQPGHDDPDNLAVMCHKGCHGTYDRKEWKRRTAETRAARNDAARPILEFLQRGQAAQTAVDAILAGIPTEEP